MDKKLYVAWQDADRRWHTIGQLSKVQGSYEFVFTKGAVPYENVIHKLFNMKLELGFRYRFQDLIPLFQNRILKENRPDFAKLSKWVGLSGSENDFEKLAKFGPIPGTDSMLVYPEPSILNDRFSVDFYVHGIRHMHNDVQQWSNSVIPGQRLLPMLDVQNEADPISAVALRAENGNVLVGYVPAFYATSISKILRRNKNDSEVKISVLRTNKDAPSQIRLFCRFEAKSIYSAELDSEEALLLLTQQDSNMKVSEEKKSVEFFVLSLKKVI
jgi:hypothetical protein